MNVTITGHVVHVPSAPWAAGSPSGLQVHVPADARLLLGRKGLVAKEPATRLALMAAYEALDGSAADGATARPVSGRTAVVVASMLSNCATVCETVDHTAAQGPTGLSVLTAPNASANIIASSVAIRFGFTGPSLLVTNGATSGIDAVRIAARLLRSRRADRVVVIGVEPVDATTRALAPGLVEGAACVVLERDVSGHPVVGEFGYDRTLPATHDRHPVPGHFHAASGVIQLASTCASAIPSRGVTVWSGDAEDGYASLRVHASADSTTTSSTPAPALVGSALRRSTP